MRFICNKNDLLKSLSTARMVVSTNNAMSILSNIHMTAEDGGLKLQCMDASTGMKATLSFVDVIEQGVATVNLDKMVGILSNLPSGDVEFDYDGSVSTIRPMGGKKVTFKLKCLPDKFPAIEWDNLSFFDVPAKTLKSMVSSTLPCISDDMARHFMCGVFFESNDGVLSLVGTDGRRLTLATEQIHGLPELAHIVPPKILGILAKRFTSEGNVELAFTDKMVYLRYKDTTLKASLVDGKYPNYRRVIPDNTTKTLGVDRTVVTDALSRVRQLTDSKSKRIMMYVSEGSIVLSTSDTDLGMAREEIPCDYKGEPVNFALNIDYLDDALNALQSDRVKMDFSEPLKPIVMRPVGSDTTLHVIMPMQLD